MSSASTAATELEVFGHDLCEPRQSGEEGDQSEEAEEEEREVDPEIEIEDEDDIDRLVCHNHPDLMSGLTSWNTDTSPDKEEFEPDNGQPLDHPDKLQTLPMEFDQPVESQWRLDLMAEEAQREAKVSNEDNGEAGEEIESSQDAAKTENKDCNEHSSYAYKL